jgi:hypothetical protein
MTALACNQDAAWGIVLDETYVYWGNCGDGVNANGAILRVPKVGGAPATLASGLVCPRGVAVDATSAYWTTQGPGLGPTGAVMKVPIAGGSPTVLAAGLGYPGDAIALDAQGVYWTEGAASNATGFVMKVPVSGGASVTLAANQQQPGAIAVDATGVYWIDAGSSGGPGALMWLPSAGGDPVTVTSVQDPGWLAKVPTGTYWTTGSGVFTLPTAAGAAPVELAASEGNAGGFAVNSQRVFWGDLVPGTMTSCGPGASCGLSPGRNAILSAPVAGGAKKTVAAWTDIPDIRYLAADETAVYWTTSACVMKASGG